MNKIPVFRSPLKNLLEQYVNHRRMLGYLAPSGEEDLRQFDVFASGFPTAKNILTKELVEAYISSRPGEKPATQLHRISTVRCLGKYSVRCGINAYVLPKGIFSVEKYSFLPRILSHEEITKLLFAAEMLPYRSNSPQRTVVISMMLRLIYCCGLRISEATKLRIDDVDLNNGILFIRTAKFNKDRYVPVTPSLLTRLQKYASLVALGDNADAPFFPSPTRGFYTASTIRHAFAQCLAVANISHDDDGPTVHSLRHSFAVHNLAKWGRDDKDINAVMPYLSAYMGHENLLGTERYLRMTIEMFPELRERISIGCSWIMPEVVYYE